MYVSCECCHVEVSASGLIIRPEESYRLWYVVVCDRKVSTMRRPWPSRGMSRHGVGVKLCIILQRPGTVLLSLESRYSRQDFERPRSVFFPHRNRPTFVPIWNGMWRWEKLHYKWLSSDSVTDITGGYQTKNHANSNGNMALLKGEKRGGTKGVTICAIR